MHLPGRKRNNNHRSAEPYRLYYMDISYFSGKMQAYLRYKEIPHENRHITWKMMAGTVLPNTGLMQVPVVETNDGDWLRDTTPMITDYFEPRYTTAPVLPKDAYHSFLCRLIEDYADEWMWRPALHYRWSFQKDRELYGRRFMEDFIHHPPGTRALTRMYLTSRQKATYVRGDGVNRTTREHVEAQYIQTLAHLEKILQKNDYLLGERPCLADFGFFASMYRHFSIDPTPGRIMRDEAPAVYAWVARLWNARASELKNKRWNAKPGRLPFGWESLLQHMGRTYLPYLTANAKAHAAGQKRFDITLEDVTYRKLPVVEYRVWCRKVLQDHYEMLPESARRKIGRTLAEHGCDQLWDGGHVNAGQTGLERLPHCTPVKVGTAGKLWWYFTGTAWHRRR